MDNRHPDEIIPDTTLPEHKAKSFEQELAALINRHSLENESDTPDFILAEYMTNCLIHFQLAVNAREKWYGRNADGMVRDITIHEHSK